MSEVRPKAEFFAVSDYPAMLDEKAATEFLQMMARSDTTQRMNHAIEIRRDDISAAVHGYVEELATAAAKGDLKKVFEQAHEIRGLAATGGLAMTGKISDGLCKYMDAASRLDVVAETAVIALHIGAIARPCSASQEARTHGEQVAKELNALVEHKLQAVNVSKTKPAASR